MTASGEGRAAQRSGARTGRRGLGAVGRDEESLVARWSGREARRPGNDESRREELDEEAFARDAVLVGEQVVHREKDNEEEKEAKEQQEEPARGEAVPARAHVGANACSAWCGVLRKSTATRGRDGSSQRNGT